MEKIEFLDPLVHKDHKNRLQTTCQLTAKVISMQNLHILSH